MKHSITHYLTLSMFRRGLYWSFAIFILFGGILSQTHAQTPADLPWVAEDCGIIIPGIAALTCAVAESQTPGERYTFALIDVNGAVPGAGRTEVTAMQDVYHHPSWDVDSIGNVFGIEVRDNGCIFLTASSNYGSALWGQDAVVRYGEIGGGVDDLSAAGTVYKIDGTTGQASVFAVLPQQATMMEHFDCEVGASTTRTSGVGLGNIVYDPVNEQYFVTNIEDGRIYRLDLNGDIIDSYDPGIYDDGAAGISNFDDLVYGIAVEPGSGRLFFGGVFQDTHTGGTATNGTPSVYSIDLAAGGGFTGAVDITNMPVGATYSNYVGTETLHITLMLGGGVTFTTNTSYNISDLDFAPNGDLLVGSRVSCQNSFHGSYNHWGQTNILSLNGGNNLYDSGVVLDLSVTGDAGNEDGYGGVAYYELADGSVQYGISSGDILAEDGPHGIAVFPSTIDPSMEVAPLGAISYGTIDNTGNGDPKGVGGEIEIFSANQCMACSLTAMPGALSCDDNSTGDNPNDDTNTFSLDVTGMENLSTMYNISVAPAGPTLSATTGTIGTPQDITISNFTDGTTYTLTITDAGDPNCSTTVMITPMACSIPMCSLTANAGMLSCDDNGTMGNDADDTNSFDLDVTGMNATSTMYNLSIMPAGPTLSATTGTIGMLQNITISNFTNGTTYTLTITDAGDMTCSTTIMVTPTACSICSLTGTAGMLTCDNNGTIGNDADDINSFDLDITGVLNSSAMYNISVIPTGPTLSTTTGTIGTSQNISISNFTDGTTYTLTITDAGDMACSTMIMVTPTACSNCTVTAVIDNQTCDDNGTMGNNADDTNTFDLDVTGMVNTSTMYDISIMPAGATLSTTTGTIGTPQSVTISNFTIGTTYTLTITDAGEMNCFTTIMLTPAPCSACVLSAMVNNTTCDDNSTADDDTDDTNSFDLDVTGVLTTSTMYNISIMPAGATLSATTGTIGTPQNISISNFTDGTTYTLTITDAGDMACSTTVMVTPMTCSDCPMIGLPVSSGDQIICDGEIATLVANTTAGFVIDWYNMPTGGTPLVMGSNTYMPTIQRTYYAEARDPATGCISSGRTPVSLTINPLPTLTADMPTCAPNLLTYTVDFTSNGTVTTNAGMISGNQVINIPIANSVTLTATSAEDCEMMLTLMPPSCACPTVNPPSSGGNQEICVGEPTPTLNATANAGLEIDWYDAATGGTLLAMNNMTYAPTVTTSGTYNYYAETRNTVNSCTSDTRTEIVLRIHPTPRMQASGQDVCEGDNIILTANFLLTSSSTSAVTWSWMGPDGFSSTMENPTPFAATTLSSGAYTVMVTDNNGCTNSEIVNIEVFPSPMIAAMGNNACIGDDISLTATFIANGTSASAASWSWNGPNGFNSTIENPTPFTAAANSGGTYTLTVIDNNGCMNTASVNVEVYQNPTLSATGDEVCEGENIILTADFITNGTSTSAASWSWMGPDGFSSTMEDPTPFASSLAADGTYTLTVIDNNGCMAVTNAVVIVNPLPSPPASAGDQVYCDGDTPPAIGVQDPGASFTVEWYADANASALVSGVMVSGFNNEMITLNMNSMPALPTAGNSVSVYAQLLDNATGCISSALTPVTITNNAKPTVVPTSIAVCEDIFQGRQGTFDLSQTVDDINTDFVEGTSPTGGSFTSTSGTLTLTFHEMMADAEIGTNVLANPTNFVNTTLGGQTIFARVEDTNTGCYSIAQVQLSVAGLPDVDGLNLMVCPDLNSTTRSEIDLTALNTGIASGNSPGSYTITWYEESTLNTLVPNPANITVSDGDDYYALVTFITAPMCTNIGRVSYSVTSLPPIMDISLEFCEDEPLGGNTTINLRDNDLMVAGGMSTIVNWFEDSNFSVPVLNPTSIEISVGGNGTTNNIFYAAVSDGNCTNRAEVTVQVNTQPLAEAGADKAICAGDAIQLSDAMLIPASSATAAAWVITLQPAAGDGIVMPMGLLSDPSTAVFTASVAGVYTLELTTDDPAGPCEANVDFLTITVNPLPVAQPSMQEVCVNSQVVIDGNPSEGTTPYMSHAWVDLNTSTATGYSLIDANTQFLTLDATGSTAGTVDLEYTITDANGCIAVATTSVMIHPLPIPSPQDDMLCVGTSLTVDGAPTGGTPAYTAHQWADLGTGTATGYSLSDTDMQILSIDASTTTDANAGTIELRYTVTDVNGCSNSADVTVTLNALPVIIVTDGNITCEPPQEVQLTATTTAAMPTYTWVGPGIVSGGTTATPTVNQPGTYTLTLTDGLTGCVNTADVFVTQDPLSKCLPATFEIRVKGGE